MDQPVYNCMSCGKTSKFNYLLLNDKFRDHQLKKHGRMTLGEIVDKWEAYQKRYVTNKWYTRNLCRKCNDQMQDQNN